MKEKKLRSENGNEVGARNGFKIKPICHFSKIMSTNLSLRSQCLTEKTRVNSSMNYVVNNFEIPLVHCLHRIGDQMSFTIIIKISSKGQVDNLHINPIFIPIYEDNGLHRELYLPICFKIVIPQRYLSKSNSLVLLFVGLLFL